MRCSEAIAAGALFTPILGGIPVITAFTHYTSGPVRSTLDAEGLLLRNMVIGLPLFSAAGILCAPFFQINHEVSRCLDSGDCKFNCTSLATVILVAAGAALIKYRQARVN